MKGLLTWIVRSLLVVSAAMAPAAGAAEPLPPGFVDVTEFVDGIRVDLRYAAADNFVGCPVDGYEGRRLILTRAAAMALRGVQADLKPFGLGLKVYDGYRPQRAVDHFVRWARDRADTKMKARYYPDVPKNELFRRGYIATRSAHSRGSTADLTIVDLQTGNDMDMGTHFDFFSPDSWPESPAVTGAQRANRLLLRTLMTRHGFESYRREWWHFSLKHEPFPETFFNFPVR